MNWFAKGVVVGFNYTFSTLSANASILYNPEKSYLVFSGGIKWEH